MNQFLLIVAMTSMSSAFTKTAKARAALQAHSAELTARERQLLILCDGRRPVTQIVDLLGGNARALVERLRNHGYLQGTASTGQAQQASPAALGRTVATAATPVPVAGEVRASQPAVGSLKARRSAAATKMYMIGVLQLLRDMEASSLAVALHTSADEGELTANALAALRFIADRSGLSYARRVADRLAEVVPEPHLPAVQAMAQELVTRPAAA
ncbi:hypothetical protein [Ottowia sp.]|uniref:hypothetical protein n=1 Tax=Ottowia sp. TaxID=1898956 RepID=UPI002C584BE2|nr:hypothetical protein [Ottowia sp.]MCP5257090.1 hypothetical protein [Burkholderiaceae bacterium]HPR44006.1 hypothetical protein [Ottowia sp.]HRW72741.1 hypothetical protein [Ottowia sp.]